MHTFKANFCVVITMLAAASVLTAGCGKTGPRLVMVYQVDTQKTEWRPDKMDQLVESLRKRLDPRGRFGISVRGVGDRQVEITVPWEKKGTKDELAARDEIHRQICTVGALEFRIVASKRFDESLIEKAAAARKEAWKKSPGTDDGRLYRNADGKELGFWCRIRAHSEDQYKDDPAAIVLAANGKDPRHLELFVLAPNSPATSVTGADIADANPARGPEGGWELNFRLTPGGGQKFQRLTGEHVPLADDFHYRLAIMMDGVLLSAPRLNSAIGDSGRITGDFTQLEVANLSDLLNAGCLPAALQTTPVKELIEVPDGK
jgi:preprotein translocase subunit SecD